MILQRHGLKEDADRWAERALTLAKTKHREVTNGKALSDFDLQMLGGLKHRITALFLYLFILTNNMSACM